jgi:hypothetical protein
MLYNFDFDPGIRKHIVGQLDNASSKGVGFHFTLSAID